MGFGLIQSKTAYKLGNDLAILLILCTLQDEIFPADQFAGTDEEYLDAGFPVCTGHRHHIRIHFLGRNHFLFLNHFFDGQDLVTQGMLRARNAGLLRPAPFHSASW